MPSSVSSKVGSFPPTFRSRNIKTNGATLHVRVGGKGPAVVMLHGFGDTGDMWAPVAAILVEDQTVVVPDLRGMVFRHILKMDTTRKRRPAISRR